MRTMTAHLESMSPLSMSRPHGEEFLKGEKHDDYEVRTWRYKAHCSEDGHIIIPPSMFHNAIVEAAKVFPEKKKGTATYTKHIETGIMTQAEPIVLPELRDSVKGERLYMCADGKPALYSKSGRVWRWFPIIPRWKGSISVHVLDDEVSEKILEHYVQLAGMAIGIGRWRPKNRGMYGRFKPVKFEWSV